MPYTDGPPWTVGQNCTVTLTHPLVNGGAAHGFYVKPDALRLMLPRAYLPGTELKLNGAVSPVPPNAPLVEMTVLCQDGLLHADGLPSGKSGEQWRLAARAYADQRGVVTANRFTVELLESASGAGVVSNLLLEEFEERWTPLGGMFRLQWECRFLFVAEAP